MHVTCSVGNVGNVQFIMLCNPVHFYHYRNIFHNHLEQGFHPAGQLEALYGTGYSLDLTHMHTAHCAVHSTEQYSAVYFKGVRAHCRQPPPKPLSL